MTSRRCWSWPYRRQAGVGLIEVLVAVLVLSIGFLGIAALQAMSLSTNNGAMARSMATIASYSILDAMRVDRDAAESGSYNQSVKADNCPAAGASLASVQLHQWCSQLGDSLGKADSTTGAVACDGTGTCTITVTFSDSRAKAGDDGVQTVITEAML